MTTTDLMLGVLPAYFTRMFFVASAVLVGLSAECWQKRRQPWALPSAFLYFTVLCWYFADLFIFPENYDFIPTPILDFAYLQVCVFLIVYRLLTPPLSKWAGFGAEIAVSRVGSPPRLALFGGTVILWWLLMGYGLARMDGDLLNTFFPLDSRNGMSMWERAAGADAGPTGFLISAATYLHLFTCASFGVWFFFLRSWSRYCALGLMVVSWPYFLLCGTRSVFLAVSLPFFFAYLLLARHHIVLKLVCLLVAFVLVDFALRTVIAYRDVGFRNLFSNTESGLVPDDDPRHEGLNMIQELCFCDGFAETHPFEYGMRYVADLTNLVPRALWRSKPLLGIDYAIWRGFEGGDSDIGVVATVSSGLIGGGVLNFGPWFGPAAPAIFMALWTGVLTRWWRQRTSFLRCLLFMVGLGLTFNLGRDITLLVLWPIVFGYIITRIVETAFPQTPFGTLNRSFALLQRAKLARGRASIVQLPSKFNGLSRSTRNDPSGR